MKNLNHERLNTFVPHIACSVEASLRFYSGTMIATFFMKLLATLRTTCICVHINYISL